MLSKVYIEHVGYIQGIFEQVYMGPEVNSNRFEISNHFENSFRLHGNFTTANLEISNLFQKLFRLHGDFTAATFYHLS